MLKREWFPAHLPASEAAPKWFEDYHDVNICGFDCIMGRSDAGRWSASGETEPVLTGRRGFEVLLPRSVRHIENVQPR